MFRKILHQPNFTWLERGEALLRRRKPWYHQHEPRPGIVVIGARLGDVAAGAPRQVEDLVRTWHGERYLGTEGQLLSAHLVGVTVSHYVRKTPK